MTQGGVLPCLRAWACAPLGDWSVLDSATNLFQNLTSVSMPLFEFTSLDSLQRMKLCNPYRLGAEEEELPVSFSLPRLTWQIPTATGPVEF